MKLRMIFAMAVVGLAACTQEQPIAEPIASTPAEQHLSDADEQKVIDQVKAIKTADGSTVWVAVEHVEKLRPVEFKFSEFVVAYGQDQSKAVMACYYIGSKRLEDDAYCDIGFEEKNGQFVPSVGTPGMAVEQELTTTQLMKGRDAFLENIDGMYQATCIDSGKKYC